MKETNELQLFAGDTRGTVRFIRSYPILGASGVLGPKLREGDMQVPEGLYRVESLNPNSAFHLSLRLNYPNAFDRAKGKEDGRSQLGGDIMIHGSDSSAGCLAMGDTTAEELFVLAHDVGLTNITVILSPVDFRLPHHAALPTEPAWVPALYRKITTAVVELPLPPKK